MVVCVELQVMFGELELPLDVPEAELLLPA